MMNLTLWKKVIVFMKWYENRPLYLWERVAISIIFPAMLVAVIILFMALQEARFGTDFFAMSLMGMTLM